MAVTLTTDAPNFPQWKALVNGDAGTAWEMAPNFRTAFFSVTGTFGAAGSVQLEGSNDGTNFFKLSPAAVTTAGLFAALGVTEYPKFIRPHVTAGDGTTALVVIGCAQPNV